MSVYQAITELIGEVPAGYEIIAWILSGCILLFLIRSVFGIISSLLEWIGGK